VDAYIGPSGVLTGASRWRRPPAKGRSAGWPAGSRRRKRELESKRATLEQQIAGLRSQYEAQEAELRRTTNRWAGKPAMLTAERTELARLRQADATAAASTRGNSKPKSKQ